MAIVTIKEFSAKYKVSRQSLYNWREEGMPTEISLSRVVRLDEEKVLEWLKKRGEKIDTTEQGLEDNN